MAGREVLVKRHVVRLSAEERERLQSLKRKGKIPAQRLLKVQILLKADVSDAGEGWSDSRIIAAFDTTDMMVYRVRKQLVEEGLRRTMALFPGQAIRIGAQQRLERFYADFGFVTDSAPYDEDDILHVEMLRPGDAAPVAAAIG